MFCYNNFGKVTKQQIVDELCALKKDEYSKKRIRDIILKKYSHDLFEGIIHLYTTNEIYSEMKAAASASELYSL